MLTIQPTKKLSDQLNNELNKEKTVEKQSLYAWHAHLFFYKRKKYVMVMNNQTRYSLIIGNLLKKDFMRFDDLIKSSIQDIFMADQFDGSGIQTYMANCEIVHIVPTNNRSTISQMNEDRKSTRLNSSHVA